jgi:hypothetical protein
VDFEKPSDYATVVIPYIRRRMYASYTEHGCCLLFTTPSDFPWMAVRGNGAKIGNSCQQIVNVVKRVERRRFSTGYELVEDRLSKNGNYISHVFMRSPTDTPHISRHVNRPVPRSTTGNSDVSADSHDAACIFSTNTEHGAWRE